MAAKERMSVSVRLPLIDKLREVVGLDQSPTTRLFDVNRAGRGTICDVALEVATWCVSGGFARDLIDRWTPEFQQRLLEVDQNAFLRGAHAAAAFLGADLEIDAERGVITVHPSDATKEVGSGEINVKPMVEPKGPILH